MVSISCGAWLRSCKVFNQRDCGGSFHPDGLDAEFSSSGTGGQVVRCRMGGRVRACTGAVEWWSWPKGTSDRSLNVGGSRANPAGRADRRGQGVGPKGCRVPRPSRRIPSAHFGSPQADHRGDPPSQAGRAHHDVPHAQLGRRLRFRSPRSHGGGRGGYGGGVPNRTRPSDVPRTARRRTGAAQGTERCG